MCVKNIDFSLHMRKKEMGLAINARSSPGQRHFWWTESLLNRSRSPLNCKEPESLLRCLHLFTYTTDVFCVTFTQSVLRQFHIPYWTGFLTQCDLVILLYTWSTLSFSKGLPVAAYVLFLVFSSVISSLQYRVLEGSSYARCDQSS
jgi:hypothetical protein